MDVVVLLLRINPRVKCAANAATMAHKEQQQQQQIRKCGRRRLATTTDMRLAIKKGLPLSGS